MSAHVVLFGPSTAGKTSLMLGLTESEGPGNFTVERTWTTRQRRPGEGDRENVLVDADTFERNRERFLFTFQTFPTYEYGIERPTPLAPDEIRMRILMPVFARKFRSLVKPPVVFCSIAPLQAADPEQVFRARDPSVDPHDLKARLARFHTDLLEADTEADIRFQNQEGLTDAVEALRFTLLYHVAVDCSGSTSP